MTATVARPTGRPVFVAYLAAVSVVGVLVLVATVATRLPDAELFRPAELLTLVALLVVSELFPIEVATPTAKDSLTISGIFACALVMGWDWSVALVAMVVASLVNDLVHRVTWWKCLFNAAQYACALLAAGLIVQQFDATLTRTAVMDERHVLVLLGAGAVFFLVNNTLTGVAIALWEQANVVRFLRSDFGFQASVNGGVIALAPVLLIVSAVSPAMIPLVLLPLWIVHRAARTRLELSHRVAHDHLTGLANQITFRSALVEAVDDAAARNRHVGVLVLDVDSFSEVNDTLGHAAGDEMLRQVATRLQDVAPPSATVARVGSDHFAVVAPNLSSPWRASEVADEIRRSFAAPFEVAGSALEVHVNAGLSVFPHHSRDVDRLVQYADAAMNVAKHTRVGFAIYQPEHNEATPRRLAILGQLRQALLRHELVVHYQPKADVATGRILGVEALLRWDHAELGAVSPGEFIPLAEHTGLIRQVTDYVLEEALRQLSEWRSGGRDLSVAVNLSARDLHDPRLPAQIARRLAVWDVPASALVIEITETAVMADPECALRVLRELSAMHITISIDDYGTGYSSLAYLTTLPVSEIKIDRSFVGRMADNEVDRVIVRSTIDLARNLGLRVVAEGVETVEAWDLLAGFGCDAVQGYKVGRPAAAAALAELV